MTIPSRDNRRGAPSLPTLAPPPCGVCGHRTGHSSLCPYNEPTLVEDLTPDDTVEGATDAERRGCAPWGS